MTKYNERSSVYVLVSKQLYTLNKCTCLYPRYAEYFGLQTRVLYTQLSKSIKNVHVESER